MSFAHRFIHSPNTYWTPTPFCAHVRPWDAETEKPESFLWTRMFTWTVTIVWPLLWQNETGGGRGLTQLPIGTNLGRLLIGSDKWVYKVWEPIANLKTKRPWLTSSLKENTNTPLENCWSSWFSFPGLPLFFSWMFTCTSKSILNRISVRKD